MSKCKSSYDCDNLSYLHPLNKIIVWPDEYNKITA